MKIVNAVQSAARQASRPGDPWRYGEPSLDEVMADPVVHQVMQRDGLTPEVVWPLLHEVRTRLEKGLCHITRLAA